MPYCRLSLVNTRSVTDWFPVPPGTTKLSVSLTELSVAGAPTTYTWGAAVVDLEYSVQVGLIEDGSKLDSPQAFSPAVQFTSSAKSKRNIGVSAAGNVRLKVSTSASTADPNVLVSYVFS